MHGLRELCEFNKYYLFDHRKTGSKKVTLAQYDDQTYGIISDVREATDKLIVIGNFVLVTNC